jgi:HPt (histidine-containing phosphotransfer) domain-containing protein
LLRCIADNATAWNLVRDGEGYMTEPIAASKRVGGTNDLTWMQQFDPRAALERLDGDEELLLMLVAVFQQDNIVLFQQLNSALNCGDLRAAERAAHSLKGLASNFDAHDTTQAAQAVEHLARAGASAELTASVRVLRERLDALCHSLAQWEAARVG